MRPFILLAVLAASAAAVELTDPDDVRRHREETRNRPAPSQERPEQRSEPPSASARDDDRQEVRTTYQGSAAPRPHDATGAAWRPRGEAEPDYHPLRGLLGGELGYYDWTVRSGTTGAGDGSSSLSTSYDVRYRIDPVVMSGVRALGRVGPAQLSAGYVKSPTDPDQARMVDLGLGLLDDDGAGFWMSELEWARVRGRATTTTAAGDPVAQDIDTTWRRFALIHASPSSFLWGVEWEDLSLPSAYSLDDPDGQVVAIFDPDTRWRTLSAIIGVDTTIAPILERRTGWVPLASARVAFGVGTLSWDEGGANRIANAYGYHLEADSTILKVMADLALGMAWQGCWHDAGFQIAAGGRLRAAYYTNGHADRKANDGQDQNSTPDYDTLVLNAHLTVVQAGVFARLTAFF